jgi:hypothetical protein
MVRIPMKARLKEQPTAVEIFYLLYEAQAKAPLLDDIFQTC